MSLRHAASWFRGNHFDRQKQRSSVWKVAATLLIGGVNVRSSDTLRTPWAACGLNQWAPIPCREDPTLEDVLEERDPNIEKKKLHARC